MCLREDLRGSVSLGKVFSNKVPNKVDVFQETLEKQVRWRTAFSNNEAPLFLISNFSAKKVDFSLARNDPSSL